MSKKNVYKETLNLPETDFPMRANLVQREPGRLKAWDEARLYHRIQKKRKAAKSPSAKTSAACSNTTTDAR